ncbi:Transcriptional regulator containing PAS, AAA-type ATPase, and DNA-binding Fis domains [Anaerovirgula multivorans]|uniref:Transcriptional regulator containing PAS, AAA-type ATPase, and DNA-binding Fis domains n=1 Tax=Anaerovirgula multivorans TaxID=312168 RepID=A0A239GPM2_9FIRM|nr:sigma 54-interacting transcriptional regulator [Anaerovirgula multivorans]SNS71149.1 Transcriptional regulator containing PAS, AAA-type ATPase, and DNA-binding Fis domains [Anaerovirgula multivorans]
MKKLAFIAFKKNTKEVYLNKLNDFFYDYRNHFELEGYSIEEGIKHNIEADLVLLTSVIFTDFVNKYLLPKSEIIYMNRTYQKNSIDKLNNLEKGISAMLVCNDKASSLENISLLYNKIGIKHIDFVPVYPDMKEIPDLEYAITPGQTQYVPSNVEHVIDIGWRVIDSSVLFNLATKLGILNKDIREKLLFYQESIVPLDHGLLYTYENYNLVLEDIKEGVIFTDNVLTIKYYNSVVEKLLNINKNKYRNKSIIDTIIPKKFQEVFRREDIIKNYLIKNLKFNKILEISKKPVIINNDIHGYFFVIKEKNEAHTRRNTFVNQSIYKGHIAKYTFEDILGISDKILDCKDRAKKIAEIDKTVLLQGESGTGKELFAQSIHNASPRRDNLFVAINCANLAHELLESELFGYEEGAFTGAKKSGKIGLIELSNKGTLFLDEIGELPLGIQAKLLRVLQEREVMRIGGTDIISVDVRIIAATNKDLKKFTETKEFREDLYYRLNVFSLKILPLRERKEDIVYLIKNIMKELGFENKKLNNELLEILINYSWRGNIRELKNCLEYMACIGNQSLTVKDLPSYLLSDINNTHNNNDDDKGVHEKVFPELLLDENELALYILKFLDSRPAGRRIIYKEAEKSGFKISQYCVRKIMDYLYNNEYIIYSKEKKGAILTDKGKKTTKNHERFKG